MRKLHCTCSAHAELDGHLLAPGLTAQRCPTCGNVLLALDDYRRWRERQPASGTVTTPSANGAKPESGAAAQARHCPACQRLMSRHRSGTAPDFHLDRCSPCQLVWLDDGEWQQLEEAGLATQLDIVLTDAWQQRIQAAEMQAGRDAALRARLGDETFAEVRRLQSWLDDHPQRAAILAELNVKRRAG